MFRYAVLAALCLGAAPLSVSAGSSADTGVGPPMPAALVHGGLQGPAASRIDDLIWSRLESSRWVADGSPDAPRVIYTFSDPNCPFCNQLWRQSRPWVDAGKVQLRHVMVGVIKEDSANKAATILAAGDPSARLAENEQRFRMGGVPAAATVPANIRRTLEANHLLMMALGFRGTPALVFREADGTVQRRSGMPQGNDLDVVMGGPAPVSGTGAKR